MIFLSHARKLLKFEIGDQSGANPLFKGASFFIFLVIKNYLFFVFFKLSDIYLTVT